MAQCKQSAPEFIQNTFSPHVAVLCSKDAEVLCQKNNLTFAQLVQPFCRLGTEGNAFISFEYSTVCRFVVQNTLFIKLITLDMPC